MGVKPLLHPCPRACGDPSYPSPRSPSLPPRRGGSRTARSPNAPQMSFRVPQGISPPGTPSPPRPRGCTNSSPSPSPFPSLPPSGGKVRMGVQTPPSPRRGDPRGRPSPTHVRFPTHEQTPPLPLPVGAVREPPVPPTHPKCHSESLKESRRRVLPPLRVLAKAGTHPPPRPRGCTNPPLPPPVGATLVVARPAPTSVFPCIRKPLPSTPSRMHKPSPSPFPLSLPFPHSPPFPSPRRGGSRTARSPQCTPHVIPSPSRNLAAGYSLPLPVSSRMRGPILSPSPFHLPLPVGAVREPPVPPTHPKCHSESLKESRRRPLNPSRVLAHAGSHPPLPPRPLPLLPSPQRTPHVIPSPSRNLVAGYSPPSCPRACGDPSPSLPHQKPPVCIHPPTVG